jgi:Fe-S-cluster-containing dehydrogenase component
MYFGDLDDSNSEVSRLLAERKHKVLAKEAGTEPNVYYLI